MRTLTVILLAFFASPLRGDEIRASSNRIHVDETVQIVVGLSGGFAETTSLTLPMSNLTAEGSPSVESSFSWMNGVSRREKKFKYTLKPVAPGTATVGPLTVRDDEGNQQTLASVTITILPEAVGTSLDPLQMIRDYASAGRERVAIVPEVSARTVVAGQQIVVTWFVYTAEAIEDLSPAGQPALSQFWVEEIPIAGREETELMVDGYAVKKLAVRRAALFPLQGGTLTIEPLSIAAEVLRPSGDVFGGFGIFNATAVTVRRRSSAVTVDVIDLPAAKGAPVGSHAIRCTAPKAAGGTATFDVVVRGNGNLRAMAAPRLAAPVEAAVEVSDNGVKVERSRDGVVMERRWTFILFPAKKGQLLIPSVAADVFDLAGQKRLTIECSVGTVEVEAATTGNSVPANERSRRAQRESLTVAAVAIPAVLALVFLAVLAARKRSARQAIDEEVAIIIGQPTARELRRALEAMLERHGVDFRQVVNENSERGELLRAVSSLVEFREKNPSSYDELTDELRAEIGELIAELRHEARAAAPRAH